MEACAQKQFVPADGGPWEHLGGPEKEYLMGHLEEAVKEKTEGRGQNTEQKNNQ
jgi:hypothetical protein